MGGKVWDNKNWWLILILFLLVSGCSAAYWLTDPHVERYLIAIPPQKIKVTTEPQGARIVIASLRNPQIYAAYAPVNILYRPHPHVPSWILVGKQGYRSTAIKINKEAHNTTLHIIMAALTEDELNQADVMSGPMMGRPSRSMGVPGQRMMRRPF